ncbi:MAG: hypothetical protein AVO38_15615 [delta proteobacterium ML8_D]|jgi:hypothetical protein|nr:MAG: hypothetical protein AVO38_15615 [delta proteobacterium ML8_D]
MKSNFSQYQKDLSKLIELSESMSKDLFSRSSETNETNKRIPGVFERNYQRWYTEASALIRQVVPERLSEFESFYLADAKRKSINATSYKIQDWLMGMGVSPNRFTGETRLDCFAAVVMRFHVQLEILKATEARFESTLLDIRQLVQVDLYDSELETSRGLHKNGFLRGAGVIAGVLLEKHLSQVCSNHSIKSRKKYPAISEFNDLLKKNNVIDVPDWRYIQRLGDLRNLCGHNKDRDPTPDEAAELIDGVEKIMKTLY